MKLEDKSSWTRLEGFDKKGFFIIQNLYNPLDLVDEVPKERGMLRYSKNLDFGSKQGEKEIIVYHEEDELQVSGSVARYNHPKYKYTHNQVRLKIEKIIGRKLFNTYYYDRFYFPGQELQPHRDSGLQQQTLHTSSRQDGHQTLPKISMPIAAWRNHLGYHQS